jgi:hypothetical protein
MKHFFVKILALVALSIGAIVIPLAEYTFLEAI